MMRIAVLVPCLNEETTVAQVVRDFRSVLPHAEIFVFDNNSGDETARCALEAGATVRLEPRRGKGFAVARMFQDVDADIYLMVDGDGTYPAHAAPSLIAPVAEGRADMVVGSRLHRSSQSEFNPINRLGNYFFAFVFKIIFGSKLTDILSGYRAFSRRFVREIPLFGGGFEIEAELTVKALQGGFRIEELPVNLVSRPPNSKSKIRIVRDGFVILSTILALVRDYKPLTTFGATGLVLFIAGLIPGTPVALHYLRTGTISSIPDGIVSICLLLLGITSIAAGLILHSVSRHFQELTYRLLRIERVLDAERQGEMRSSARTTQNVR
jgi:glycosyltransferase involved in cell wall biosynthesis